MERCRLCEGTYYFYFIADDLTGANNAATQFAVQGLKAITLLNATAATLARDADVDVVALETESKSRNLPADEAAARVRDAVAPLLPLAPGTIVFKKVDSTLRGNIGVEMDALLELTGISQAVIAPGFPANARILVGGYLLVGLMPVARTYAGPDVLAPVRSSHVPEILGSQTRRRLSCVGLCEFERGPAAVKHAVVAAAAGGSKLLVLDAAEQADLELAVSACRAVLPNPLWTGSAGLARALAKVLFPEV